MNNSVPLPFNDRDMETLQRLIVPIVAVLREEIIIPLGSGFIVGTFNNTMKNSAILMTAAHVINWTRDIENPRKRNHPTALPEFLPPQEKEYYWRDLQVYVLLYGTPNKVYAATIWGSWYDLDRDIALCGIGVSEDAAKENYRLKTSLKINSRGPHVGANVIAAGYHSLEKELDDMDPQQLKKGEIEFDGNIDLYGGVVTQLYHDRGPRKHTWPCFSSNLPFYHGMSGGPVIQITGNQNSIVACGVISSDFTAMDSEAGNEPMASIMWTSFYMSTDIKINPGLKDELKTPSFLDLVKVKVIKDVMGADRHVSINYSDDGIPTVTWTHPNDFEAYVNDCIRKHTSGETARFLYIFFKFKNGNNVNSIVPIVSAQQAISYYATFDVLSNRPNENNAAWDYVIVKPDYSGLTAVDAKRQAENLARLLNESPRLFIPLKDKALFGKTGERLDLKETVNLIYTAKNPIIEL